ncbi:MAG: hypothetical protein EOP45_20900, partial [Sphingobacteriaceae bacterium]
MEAQIFVVDDVFHMRLRELDLQNCLSKKDYQSLQRAVEGPAKLDEVLMSFAKKVIGCVMIPELKSIIKQYDEMMTDNKELTRDIKNLNIRLERLEALQLENSRLSQRLEGYTAMKEDHKDLISKHMQTQNNLDNLKIYMKS